MKTPCTRLPILNEPIQRFIDCHSPVAVWDISIPHIQSINRSNCALAFILCLHFLQDSYSLLISCCSAGSDRGCWRALSAMSLLLFCGCQGPVQHRLPTPHSTNCCAWSFCPVLHSESCTSVDSCYHLTSILCFCILLDVTYLSWAEIVLWFLRNAIKCKVC